MYVCVCSRVCACRYIEVCAYVYNNIFFHKLTFIISMLPTHYNGANGDHDDAMLI